MRVWSEPDTLALVELLLSGGNTMPSTCLETLVNLVPPPGHPVHATGDWSQVQKDLGLTLPDDYRTMVNLYGTGRFYGDISLWNPFRAVALGEKPLADLDMMLYVIHQYEFASISLTRKLFPEKDGLLPCANTIHGDFVFWATIGSPNDWWIVFYQSDEATFYDHIDLSLSGFVVARIPTYTVHDGSPFGPDDG
jgi:hypothetical protein